MQAECPHCQTIFKLTEQQLQIADGMVRCGMCQEVFNALDHGLSIDPTNPDADTEDEDLPATDETELTSIDDSDASDTEDSDTENSDISDTEDADLTAQEELNNAIGINEQEDSPYDTQEQTVTEQQQATDETVEAPEEFTEFTEAINELSALNENKSTISGPVVEYESSDDENTTSEDITDDSYNTVSNKVVPDQFQIPEIASPYSVWQDTGWVVAILLLTTGLMLQLAWFNRNDLINDDALRPWAIKLCNKIDCSSLALKDPQQIEMLNRNVYSHPNANDALMVSVSMINHATFTQPYPNIRIDFSNVRGETITSRTFRPEEYLNQPANTIERLSSGANADFSLEIQDPGPEAMTYEFDFL